MSIQRLEVGYVEHADATQALVTVYSSHTKRRHDISIYNAKPKAKNVPVIVLLHGVYGNHWVWQTLGHVDKVYDSLRKEGLHEFVLVMPSDGGIEEGSGYLSLRNGEDYEAWIAEDVIRAVNSVVDNVCEQSPIFISGLSMGGFGALRLGCKYPERFKAISAHSSITQLSDFDHFTEWSDALFPQQSSDDVSILFWAKKHKTSLPPLRFDCGKDDVLYQSNQKLKALFEQHDIPHQFNTFDGEHGWAYWQEHVADSLRFFDSFLKES